MKSFTTYKSSGEIIGSGYCPDDMLEDQAHPERDIYVMEGSFNYNTQYIFEGVVKEKPPKPEGAYIFDYTTYSWVPNTKDQEYNIVLKRNDLLKKSDWTQLSDVVLNNKEQWQIYRQQLRDITAQPGYPFNVVWPTPPQ